MTTPAAAERPTVPLVRAQIRDLLLRSPAFHALDPARQRELAHDVVNVAQYMVDGGGETYGAPLAAEVLTRPSSGLARGLADESAPDTAGADFDAQGGAVAARSGTDVYTDLVSSVDFPAFVAGLLDGVFNAIVTSSIQQMEAFAELVANISKSVDQYMRENVSPNQARDWLSQRYPDHLEVDIRGKEATLQPRKDADESTMPDFFTDLGLDAPIDSLDASTAEEVLVPAARQQMAIDRQRMLLMLVLMGINRLVVTDGSIRAAVIFQLDTRDRVHRNEEFKSRLKEEISSSSKNGLLSGWFSPRWQDDTTQTVKVSTTRTDESAAAVELKAKLTGDVNVRFKTETYPLDQITQLLGVPEPQLPVTAPRPTG